MKHLHEIILVADAQLNVVKEMSEMTTALTIHDVIESLVVGNSEFLRRIHKMFSSFNIHWIKEDFEFYFIRLTTTLLLK